MRLQNLNIIQDSFNRPNLSYEVKEKRKDIEKNIIQVIYSTESALIYCSTKRECEEVNALLESKGFQASHIMRSLVRL